MKSNPANKTDHAIVRITKIILATLGSFFAALSGFFPGRPILTPPTLPPAAVKVRIENNFNEGANANIKTLLHKLKTLISELTPFPHMDSDSSVEAWKNKLVHCGGEFKEILDSLVRKYISVTDGQLKTSLTKLLNSLGHVIQEIDTEFTRTSRQELRAHVEDLVGAINDVLEALEKQQDINNRVEHPVAGTHPPDIPPQ